MTFVAKRMMRMIMISTMTPIMIIIFMFFHQYFLATRVDVLWNESAWKDRENQKSIKLKEWQNRGDCWLFCLVRWMSVFCNRNWTQSLYLCWMEKVGHMLWLAVVNEEITEEKNIAPFYLYMQHKLLLLGKAPVHPGSILSLSQKMD